MLSITRVMARYLYVGKDVKLFHFHEIYGVDPVKILIAARFFVKCGTATIEDRVLSSTDRSRAFIYEHRHKFFGQVVKPWRDHPVGIVRPFEPYLPDLARVNIDFFQNFVDPTSNLSQ